MLCRGGHINAVGHVPRENFALFGYLAMSQRSSVVSNIGARYRSSEKDTKESDDAGD
jgi:hypothetical protein